jgi:glycerophosphoryl diester phosphodiesterase
MPDETSAQRRPDRLHALLVVCVLAVASLVIAFLGATPARVSATELWGQARTPGDQAFIASHRGGGATAPENTLPAITAALASGFDYVEVDVALTVDMQPVLMHDATVDRTTNGHGRLADLTLAEVEELDAGAWFDPAFAGTPVPRFTEFLDVLAGAGRRAIVELKGEWDEPTVAALVAEITHRGLERSVAMASFDARTLALAGTTSAVLSRLVIVRHLPSDIVRAVQEAGVRGIIVDRRAVLEEPVIVDELHAAGIRVVVYTLNSDKQWDEVTALGVDGIVTDDPATLSKWQRSVAGER